jgi:hypothetical protein
MLNLVSEVKDLPNAVVWRPKEKEDAMFSAEIFRSKIASPNDVHRAQHLMYLVGIGLEEKTQGVVDEGGANRNKPGQGGEEENIKLGGVENVNLRIAGGSKVALVGSSGKKCRVSFS